VDWAATFSGSIAGSGWRWGSWIPGIEGRYALYVQDNMDRAVRSLLSFVSRWEEELQKLMTEGEVEKGKEGAPGLVIDIIWFSRSQAGGGQRSTLNNPSV